MAPHAGDRRPQTGRRRAVLSDLRGDVAGLLREQAESWPLLGKGLSGLAAAGTRAVVVAGRPMLVRHIPHRVTSTTAPVDRESVRKRPCFLCPQNLYPEQRGLPFRDDFTIYANPFPIVERHLTIVHREHRPQRIAGRLGAMLDLAAALPGSFVLYNGPECGASAPDHLHLQAGSCDGLPIVRDSATAEGPTLSLYGARALLFRGADRSRLVEEADRALAALSAVTGRSPEPWVNVCVFGGPGDTWTVVLFPRGKHRPDVFHTGELTVSPATVDLCGILVAPVAKDFARITGDDVEAVFREVTLPEAAFLEVVASLEAAR